MKTQQLTEMSRKFEGAWAQLDLINASIEEQKVRYKKSEEDRLKIISSLNRQVTTLRNQVPPKKCEDAINWAVENKSDVIWPK